MPLRCRQLCGGRSSLTYAVLQLQTRFVERGLPLNTVPPEAVLDCLHMAGSLELWEGSQSRCGLHDCEAMLGMLLGLLQQQGVDINTPVSAGEWHIYFRSEVQWGLQHTSKWGRRLWQREYACNCGRAPQRGKPCVAQYCLLLHLLFIPLTEPHLHAFLQNAAGDTILHLLADLVGKRRGCVEAARKVLEAGASKL